MIFSISSSTERARRLAGVIAALAVAATLRAAEPTLAIFPPLNRAGTAVPEDVVATALATAFSEVGYPVLPATDLESFLEQHRVRDTSGLASDVAAALGAETHVRVAIVTSIDDWDEGDPPRVALTARCVAANSDASILWIDSQALHGWERPGAFEQGIVFDWEILLQRAARGLAESLARAARAGESDRHNDQPKPPPRVERRFRPASIAVDPGWAAAVPGAGRPRIAVLPFVTNGVRREIGEVLMMQFVRHLAAEFAGSVLEPGIVRNALLEARVIQDGGPSLPQVDALRALLDVDLVVSGFTTDFEPSGTAPYTPSVGFSARAIDSASRQVVWSAVSHARGDDRLGPFGSGRIRSSLALSSELARGVVQEVAGEVDNARARASGAEGKKKTP